MGEEAKKRIEEALAQGYSKEQIAESFREKLKASDVPAEDINLFLGEHNLTGTVTQESFGRQLSDSMRGFGRDVASGIGGAATLAKAGTGPLGQVLSLGGSYAMGSAGQGIEDLTRGEAPPTFGEAVSRYHQAGMKGLKDELIGGSVGKVAEKLLAPNVSKMTPQDLSISEYAKANRLPMKASDVFPSKTAKTLEWVGDSLLLGKATGDYRRKQLSSNIQSIIEDTTKTLPVVTDKGTAGIALSDAIKEARTALKQDTTIKYKKLSAILEDLGDGVRPDGTVDKPLRMENFISVAEKWRNQISNEAEPELRQFLASIADRAGDGTNRMYKSGMTGKELDVFQKQIWEQTFKKRKYVGAELWDAVEKDLIAEEPHIWSSVKEAKDAAKFQTEFRNNPTVKAVASKVARGDVDNVILAAFRSGNIEDVNVIKKAISPEAWDIASSRFVQNILDLSTDNATGAFLPVKFLRGYATYQKQIRNVMPEVADNLDTLAEVMRRSLDDITKGQSTSTGTILRGAASGGAVTGAIASGNVGLLVPEGFSIFMANSMRSPKGKFKQLLTQGFNMPGTTKMLRLGGRFVDFDSPDQGS